MKKIHEPYDKLKGWLREKRIVYKEIADLIGVSVPTVSAKINGDSDFFLSEVKLIKNRYKPEEDIFFIGDVALKQQTEQPKT